MARIIAIANQKGGTGKTTTTLNLGAAWAAKGKRVLLVDMDHQASLSVAAGIRDTDSLDHTVPSLMASIISGTTPDPAKAIIHCREGYDLIPGSIDLAKIDLLMATVTVGRERIAARMLEPLRSMYDLILLDCAPALNMITVNDLVAADGVLIPMCAQYLSSKGLDQLLGVIADARQANPSLTVDGIVVTMRLRRSNGQDEVEKRLRSYGDVLPVLDSVIPRSVRAEEAPATGRSLLEYDPTGTVANAYRCLANELDRRLATDVKGE